MAHGFYVPFRVPDSPVAMRIIQGKWRSRDFDNHWIFNLLGGYRPNRNWEFSARWSYIGDRPVTPIDIVESKLNNATVWDMSRFNEGRLASYHSLFLRTDRRFFLSSSNITTYFEVWNAYNRSNEFMEF